MSAICVLSELGLRYLSVYIPASFHPIMKSLLSISLIFIEFIMNSDS